jgi:hypothetical protein
MRNMTKIALSAVIILSTAFSALTAANASATREQAGSTVPGQACYDGDGGIVSCNFHAPTNALREGGALRPLPVLWLDCSRKFRPSDECTWVW